MCRATCPVIQTLTTTAPGASNPTTVRCGIPPQSQLAGLRTAMVTGTGLALGAGRGLIMRLGALRRTTMAVGDTLAGAGAGAPDLSMPELFMARRLSGSLAERIFAAVLDLGSVEASAGSHSDGVNRIILGSTRAASSSTTSIFTTRRFAT